ncbi:MAG: hypothetical protein J0L55_12910 [Caulobacterales bacterium]|nr:hypothetical protein [Caulobacterales bacterium]MCA0372983.1 hypothetical protein [Pseudomonadota bacterium]
MNSREIIYEFIQIGNQTKVSAIDVISGTEVSVITPTNAPRSSQTLVAKNKLIMILKKNGIIQ